MLQRAFLSCANPKSTHLLAALFAVFFGRVRKMCYIGNVENGRNGGRAERRALETDENGGSEAVTFRTFGAANRTLRPL